MPKPRNVKLHFNAETILTATHIYVKQIKAKKGLFCKRKIKPLSVIITERFQFSAY